MKGLLCAVAAIALIAPAAATVQPQHNRHENRDAQHRGDRNTGHSRHDRQPRPANNHQSRQRPYQHQNRQTRGAHRNSQVANHGLYRPGHRPSSFHRIHAQRFYYPRGYHYRRWNVGLILPRIFLGSRYYWSDWRALGLLPPPPGFVWVRFGPDLLLVNRYTGRIVDVIYGAFY